MKLSYPICVYPGDVSGYTVIVPDLPGCVTEGETIEEALEMAADAAAGWLLDELEDGNPLPAPSRFQDVRADEYEDGIVTVVAFDLDEYAEKFGNKAIRKNCTIPAWLNTAAERKQVNFSAVLQQALMSELGYTA